MQKKCVSALIILHFYKSELVRLFLGSLCKQPFAINGWCSRILHSSYCKPVRAPLLASLSIARQHHQRHGHRQERSAVLHYTRARSRAKKGGALEACRAPLRYISGLAKDTVLATSGVGVAGYTIQSRAPGAGPRARLFSVATQGQNVVSGSLWPEILSCN